MKDEGWIMGGSANPDSDKSGFLFNTADGVLAVDRDQRIVFWNKTAAGLLGFTTEEVLGRFCYEVIGSQDEEGCLVCRRNCLNFQGALRREAPSTREMLVRSKAGQEVWLSVSTLVVPSRWADLWVLAHLFRNISAQKELERSVKQLLSKFATSRPMETGPLVSQAFPLPSVNLTAREREVLVLLGSGASAKAIATKLGISVSTARNHINNMLPKLGVHSRLEAVTLSLRSGII